MNCSSNQSTETGLYWRLRTLVLAACISGTLVSGIAGSQTDELQFGLSPAYGTPMAPPLDLPGLDGKQYRLSNYIDRVVIVNFWATWCPPCITEMPTLQKAWDLLHGDDFEILAVNLGEDQETISKFVESFEPELKFPILLTEDQSIMQTWRIQALPMSYIIDKAGRWVYIELGPRDFSHQHIIEILTKLMGAEVQN